LHEITPFDVSWPNPTPVKIVGCRNFAERLNDRQQVYQNAGLFIFKPVVAAATESVIWLGMKL